MKETSDALTIAEMAVKKAGSRRKAATAAGINRKTLDSIFAGEHKPWPRTLENLKNYALGGKDKPG